MSSRWLLGGLAIGAVALVLPPSTPAANRAGQEVGARQRVPAATAARRGRHPSCGSYCRQAGGYGAPPPHGHFEPPGVFIPKQVLRMGADDVVGVRAKCLLKHTCKGAMILSAQGYPTFPGIGRDDLRIRAHRTRVVYVQISEPYASDIRQRGRLRHVSAGAWLSNTRDLNISGQNNLTIVAAR